jgi:hypothetical protein
MLKKKKIWIVSASALVIVVVVFIITTNPFQGDDIAHAKESAPIEEMKPTESAIATDVAVAEDTTPTEQVSQASEPVEPTKEDTPVQSTSNNNTGNNKPKPAPAPPPAPAPSPDPPEKVYVICNCGAKFTNATEWQTHYDAYKKAATDYNAKYGGIFPSDAEVEEFQRLSDEWHRHNGWKTSDA